MAKTMRKLTNEEKVLAHLGHYEKYKDSAQSPVQVTQEGIGHSLAITQSHVSYALKALIDSKDVEQARLSHIKGIKRRRKAYYLSDKGYRRYGALAKDLQTIPMTIIDTTGATTGITLGEASEVTELDILTLMNMASDRGVIDLSGGPVGPEGRDAFDIMVDKMGSLFEVGVASTAEVLRGSVDLAEKVGKGSITIGKDTIKKTAKKTKKLADRIFKDD